MQKNIGKKDRIIRGVIGVLLLIGALYYQSIWLCLGALFVFFEVCMSWCVMYQILGKNSCPLSDKKDPPSKK